jgi:hypothetical protein
LFFHVLFSVVLYLSFSAIPGYSCDKCEGQCDLPDELIHWNLDFTSEVAAVFPGSLEDAGLFIGMKGCDVAAGQDYRRIIVEVVDESHSIGVTDEVGIFLEGLKEHITYREGYEPEVIYHMLPDEPYCYMPRSQVVKLTDADFLITCKYLGSTALINEYSGLHSGEVVLRHEIVGSSTFRCMMTALKYSISGEKLLYIDEVDGGYSVSNEFILRDGVSHLMYGDKRYKHFSGMDECLDNYVALGLIRYIGEDETECKEKAKGGHR